MCTGVIPASEKKGPRVRGGKGDQGSRATAYGFCSTPSGESRKPKPPPAADMHLGTGSNQGRGPEEGAKDSQITESTHRNRDVFKRKKALMTK